MGRIFAMLASYTWVCLRIVAPVGLLGLVLITGCAPIYLAESVDVPETPRHPSYRVTGRVELSLPSDTYSIQLAGALGGVFEYPPGKSERTYREEVAQVIRRVTEESSLFHLSPAGDQSEKVSEADHVMIVRFLVEQNMDWRYVKLMGVLVSAATLCIVPLWVPYDVYLSAQVIDRKTQRSRYYTVQSRIDEFVQIPLWMLVPLHRSWTASRALEIVTEQLTKKLYADMEQDGLF